jgi:hypothetical protein
MEQMISFKDYCKRVDEQTKLEEGSIANIEQKLKDHAQRKIDHEAKYGQMNGADLHSHEQVRTRLLQQKKKLQSAKMRSESVELDESVPVDKAHKAVQEFLGQSSATKFMTHLRPGTDKHTTWAKINTALTKQGVKPQHIATIATKIKPAQYESVELEEAEGLTTKKADVGHHVFYNGTKIGHVESRKVPWLRGKTITKIIAKKADGTEVPVDSDANGKNTVESAKQTLLKHHLKSESEIHEAIKGWKHAHGDIMKSRAAASSAENSVKLHRLKADGKTESGMHDAAQTFKSEEDAHAHVAKMKQLNPGKKMHWNKYVSGKHVGVLSTVSESVQLDESTFTSDSPSTNASRGVKFDVVKDKAKSIGVHANGQPVEHHDVFHNGVNVGKIHSYSGYKDKKASGSRIVSSRKDVKHWMVQVHPGHHNRDGNHWSATPEHSPYTASGFSSKKEALQHLADAHKSNPNR